MTQMPVSINCLNCKKQFEVLPYKATSAKYCSRKCQHDPMRKVSIQAPDKCWPWLGGTHEKGYGRISNRGYAHVIIYKILIGDVPQGLELDHLCKNKICVNPKHLEPVSHQVNVVRGDRVQNARRSPTCTNGHQWTAANTYIHPTQGSRVCRICTRESVARYQGRS